MKPMEPLSLDNPPFSHSADPFKWLEDIQGKRALTWVNKRNTECVHKLGGHSAYHSYEQAILHILNSEERIPQPVLRGQYVYDFRQDSVHEQGIWRRMSRQDFLNGHNHWDILLDMDNTPEMKGMVFAGARNINPVSEHFLVSLSRGGSDAAEIREFNANTKCFVDTGFKVGEAKGGAEWIDFNHLLISSWFGKESMTSSGYPRQVRHWIRGTPIDDARLLLDCPKNEVGVFVRTIDDSKHRHFVVERMVDFFHSRKYLLKGDQLTELDIPLDTELITIVNKQVILRVKSPWKRHRVPEGGVVGLDYPALMRGEQKMHPIYFPDEKSAVSSMAGTKDHLLMVRLRNVRSELHHYHWNGKVWESEKFCLPVSGQIRLGSADPMSDDFFFTVEDFLTPTTLYRGNASNATYKALQSTPVFFRTTHLKTHQFHATSADGTPIPYFVTGPETLPHNAKNPTLLTAYGGFEVPKLPAYNAITGKCWLEEGGIYVVANIRGGGEFGPSWHRAGLKEKREKVFEDFYAVAKDLIGRGICSPSTLGIQGGSNGGLLMGVAFTRYPQLFGAVVCQVPLLDMERFHKLLAGASWKGEYGDPEIPEELGYLLKYSPYHNLNRKKQYPEVLFTTSARDDRVHPAHARKMSAKMSALGHKNLYFENQEGGHAGAATNKQRAEMLAMIHTYLRLNLMHQSSR